MTNLIKPARALALALSVAIATTAVVAWRVPVASAAEATAADKALVDAAKARGEVGEQGDGYLGIVGAPVSAEIRSALTDINAGRAEVYKDTAAKTGVTAEAAGQATARQLFARVPAGQMYKPLDGAWTKK